MQEDNPERVCGAKTIIVDLTKDEDNKWQVALASGFRKPLNNAQSFISAIQLGKTAIYNIVL